ncbi:MAG: acetyl-CoA carboxylase biotin carboxyl carrier protein [Armatimonadota bacterium]
MAELDIDVAGIKKLVELVERHALDELTVEEGDLAVTIRGSKAPVPTLDQHTNVSSVVEPPSPEPAAQAPPPEPTEPIEPIEGNIVDIVAPLVGVFYRCPAPDAPPFVEVGDQIEVGTEIGLIEAMKVFSPIPSEVAGEVVAIPAENGKLVQQGEVLVRVRVPE